MLIARQFNLVIDAWTGNVQVAVYLTDPARPDTVTRIQSNLEQLDAVASIEYWDKAETCALPALFEGQEVFREGVDCEKAIPTSLRINLADPSQFDQIGRARLSTTGATEQIQCTEPGVRDVSDYRDLLDRLTTITRVLSIRVLSIAVIMLASAIALVANTLRMGMLPAQGDRHHAASGPRTKHPSAFLIEGLVEGAIGDRGDRGALRDQGLLHRSAPRPAQFFPLIRNADVLAVTPWILIAAVVVAVIAGTIGMRRFLDV